MIKYSILMPYIERAGHLHNTLLSIRHFYSTRSDYEIIIVEDQKNIDNTEEHQALIDVISTFPDINIVHLEGVATWNPSVHFNHAANTAQGDILIITNPECMHRTDILSSLDKHFSTKPTTKYIVSSCRNVSSNDQLFAKAFYDIDMQFLRWYQHKVHRGAGYHFLSAIHKDTYWDIGGFDPDFAEGYAYEDNDFRDNVMDKGIEFIQDDRMQVDHQSHGKKRPKNYQAMLNKNHELYLSKWG